MIKKSLLLLIVVFGALSLSVLAQKSELAVENVDFLVEGDRIVVVYDITNSKEAEVYDIDLKFVTESNNVIIPKTVSGDIGRRVKGGRYKKITWDVLTDKGDVNEKMKAVITITSVVNSLFENVGGGPSNMFLSMLMPGLGDYYVKKDKTRKRPYWLIPVTVYSLYTWSSVSNSIYKSKYQEYHDATDQETMDAE
ncbi:MAG: hypothetical protein KJ607_04450, partial [Bacteroidetes bacterium]|nr:hypothetical protein [Bacteroidota bacterium]